jgi:hypothetical protein
MLAERTERIQVEIDGAIFVGERRIEGTRKELHQTIFFNGKMERDTRPYNQGELELMRLMAQLILDELVTKHLACK